MQNLLIGVKFAIFYLNWYLSLFLNDRMGLQVQEVATIRESLGLNCSLTVLGPDGLRLECLGVADECPGQQVKFSYPLLCFFLYLACGGAVLGPRTCWGTR